MNRLSVLFVSDLHSASNAWNMILVGLEQGYSGLGHSPIFGAPGASASFFSVVSFRTCGPLGGRLR